MNVRFFRLTKTVNSGKLVIVRKEGAVVSFSKVSNALGLVRYHGIALYNPTCMECSRTGIRV